VCDVDIDPSSGAGGLVTFQPDDHSREVRRRFEEEGLVGHPPDTEWFCTAHVDLAREVATTWTLPDGLREVEARSRTIDPLMRTPPGSEMRWVQWDLDGVVADDVLVVLRRALPSLVAEATGSDLPGLQEATERRWSPMDGAQPPWCPFTETTELRGALDDATTIVLRTERAQWNEDDVSSVSISLTIGDQVSVVAFGATGGGNSIRTVRLYRPTTTALVSLVDQAVSSLGRTTGPPRQASSGSGG
jgi:hypothetical protein